jgi:hypothetical protein
MWLHDCSHSMSCFRVDLRYVLVKELTHIMRRHPFSLTALLTALVFLIASHASAQEAGVMGGINITTLAVSPAVQRATGPDQRVGAAAGGFFTAPVGGKLDLRIEGLFSQRGANQVFAFKDEIKLNYVDVAALAQVNLHKRGQSGAFLLAGTTVAFNVAATYVDNDHIDGGSEDIRSDLDNRTDVGFTAGGGVRLGPATFDARYTWGLLAVAHDGYTGSKLMNRTVTVTVGFPLWRRH